MSRKELLVKRIEHGTVIDHITAGQALNVLRILGISGRTRAMVTMAMNVKSGTMKLKDIVKVANRELSPSEVDKIALISPEATINIIRDFEVIDKYKVTLPDYIEGVVRCVNRSCISNTDEPVTPKFNVVSKSPVRMRCIYCERSMSKEIPDHLL